MSNLLWFHDQQRPKELVQRRVQNAPRCKLILSAYSTILPSAGEHGKTDALGAELLRCPVGESRRVCARLQSLRQALRRRRGLHATRTVVPLRHSSRVPVPPSIEVRSSGLICWTLRNKPLGSPYHQHICISLWHSSVGQHSMHHRLLQRCRGIRSSRAQRVRRH